MDQPQCSNCVFWKALGKPDLSKVGLCRRSPPGRQLTFGDAEGLGILEQPRTRPDDWCGEHSTINRTLRPVQPGQEISAAEWNKLIDVVNQLARYETGG